MFLSFLHSHMAFLGLGIARYPDFAGGFEFATVGFWITNELKLDFEQGID